MSKLSPGKRDRIQQRTQEWKRFLAGNDNKDTPAALAKNRVQHQQDQHYNPHDSDRRRRLQLQLMEDDDEPVDRTWRRRVQAQDLAAQTEQRQTTLHEMHAPKEDDTAQDLQEKRLREAQEDAAAAAAAAREEQERRRRQQEEKEKALQAEMAAPCTMRPSLPPLPRRRPRRSRKHARRQRDSSSSWLGQFVSVLVAATACCAGDECLGEDDATVAMELETSE